MATGSINISSNISRNTLLSAYAPKPCKNLTAKAGDRSTVLKWEDPENYATTDGKDVVWKYTRIVRKTGSYPINENDGTIVTESSIKNQYKSNGYTDSGLTPYTTYYYRAFSCSTDGVYNHEPVQGTAQPTLYRIMTVKINLSNSNPATCGSYADDATAMSSGKDVAAWQEFFRYRPCLFKDGKVVGYLKPDDFTKFEDGTAADITSGNAGNVMIQFPRCGIRISKSGKVVTVSMTNNPNDSSFKYYAHQRGSVNKDYFYLGAYDGYVNGNKLHSLSGKSPTIRVSLKNFDTYGKANGTGYGCIGYYQWLFLQVMYVLQFKGNLNSQSTVGHGNVASNNIKNTGRSNTRGMIYGDNDVAKLFGIEDVWGNVNQLVNNYHVSSTHHVQTTTDDTITTIRDYTDRGSYGNNDISARGYYTDCMGTTEAGFTLTYGSTNGSTTTYFCDLGMYYDGYYPAVGGGVNHNDDAGIFSFECNFERSYSNADICSRLQYL